MARPTKQTIDYFPHYVVGGKTLFILESSYGNDGYALWFKLLEILGSTEGHYYDCSNTPNWMYLISRIKVSEEKVLEILNMLADLDAIDKELWLNDKIIWVQHLVDNVADVYKSRKSDIPQKPSPRFSSGKPHEDEYIEEFPARKPEQNGVSSTRNPQSRVEESREKESKGEERRENDSAASAEIIDPDNGIKNVVEAFNSNIHLASSMEIQKLQDWLKDVEPDVVVLAIGEAVTYSKRSMGYINAVLNNWHNQNIRTKQGAEAYLRDRKDDKGTPVGRRKYKNAFNDYDQREYNIKELEKKLLGRDDTDEYDSG
jgi:DnaD/phage-associated family protein